MFVNEIQITKKKNLGNYESFEVKLSASMTEEDNFEVAYNTLMSNISVALQGKPLGTGKQTVVMTANVEASPKKKAPAKKRASTKKTKTSIDEPVVVPTIEEMMVLCRETAGRLKSGDKIKELIKLTCGVDSLKEASEDTYAELAKKLKDA